MTIPADRLREIIALSKEPLPDFVPLELAPMLDECFAMASELLAARETIDDLQVSNSNMIASMLAAIARAEKAEADAVAENKNAHALLASLDAARAEADHSLLKYQDACNDLADRTRERVDAVRSAIAARAEVERLRAELATLTTTKQRLLDAANGWKADCLRAQAERGEMKHALNAAQLERDLARDAKGAK